MIQAGEVCSSRVADGGVHNRNLIFGAGIGHTLSCQGGNGHHRIIAIGNHLGADLVQRGSVVLAVKIFILNGNALFGGFGVQLCFHSGADLIQAGVIQLLDHRNFVRLCGIICGSSFAAGSCSGIGAGGSGRSGGGGGTATNFFMVKAPFYHPHLRCIGGLFPAVPGRAISLPGAIAPAWW